MVALRIVPIGLALGGKAGWGSRRVADLAVSREGRTSLLDLACWVNVCCFEKARDRPVRALNARDIDAASAWPRRLATAPSEMRTSFRRYVLAESSRVDGTSCLRLPARRTGPREQGETTTVGSAPPEMLELSGCWWRFVRNRKGIDTNSRYNRLSKR